jgi:predicted RND superfamily exporter protein
VASPTEQRFPNRRFERYAAWIERHRRLILAASILIAVAAGTVAARLPLRPDFSYLLPPASRSVQDLRAIEKRSRVIGTVVVAVESDDPVKRRIAARAARERIVALGPDLVHSITFDEAPARKFAWVTAGCTSRSRICARRVTTSPTRCATRS